MIQLKEGLPLLSGKSSISIISLKGCFYFKSFLKDLVPFFNAILEELIFENEDFQSKPTSTD